jgi:hypothetical protein
VEDINRPVTLEDILRSKAEQRTVKARASFESKLQSLLRLQRMNYALKRAGGRQASRPWSMSEEAYQRENHGHDHSVG